MKRKRATRWKLAELTDDVSPDDGQDPKLFFDRRLWNEAPPKAGRKALQLCEQVKRALTAILAECSDDVVRNLMVVAVRPAPHAGRLEIAVAVEPTADAMNRATIELHLDRATHWVRTQIAAVITRRKVPELVWTC